MLFESVIVVRPILEALASIIEIVGVIIIIYAAIVTGIYLIKAERKSPRQAGHDQHEIKLQFTTRLLTALEFFIAADIIKTIASPEPTTLLVVAVTIAIRAALTFLLHKEQGSQRQKENKEQQDKQQQQKSQEQ